MAEKSRIHSLNDGIARELRLVELEEKVELSPIGILDLLVSSPEVGDDGADDCRKFCDVRNCQGYCEVNNDCTEDTDCKRDECTILGDCKTFEE